MKIKISLDIFLLAKANKLRIFVIASDSEACLPLSADRLRHTSSQLRQTFELVFLT
jgi:hypothetical protein